MGLERARREKKAEEKEEKWGREDNVSNEGRRVGRKRRSERVGVYAQNSREGGGRSDDQSLVKEMSRISEVEREKLSGRESKEGLL